MAVQEILKQLWDSLDTPVYKMVAGAGGAVTEIAAYIRELENDVWLMKTAQGFTLHNDMQFAKPGYKWEQVQEEPAKPVVSLHIGQMYDRNELVEALGEDCSKLSDSEMKIKVGEKFKVEVLDYGATFHPRYLIGVQKKRKREK